MGRGWCRPDECDIKSVSCRVNGFQKKESSFKECSTACFEEISCVGFSISSRGYGVPNLCYVYGNIPQQNLPSGWSKKPTQYFKIGKYTNDIGVMCYNITGNLSETVINFYK